MPFLNHILVRDIEIGQDFNERREAMAHLVRHACDIDHGAVDAQTRLVEILPRLKVYVGRSATKADQ